MIWLLAAIIVSSLINTNFCPAQRVIDTFFRLKKSGKDFRKVCQSTYFTGFKISLLYHLANRYFKIAFPFRSQSTCFVTLLFKVTAGMICTASGKMNNCFFFSLSFGNVRLIENRSKL